MVLRHLLVVAALAGCNSSLFDAHGATDAGGGGGGDGNVPVACPTPCLADAAADFNAGSGPWRYLDDTRNRMWTAMTGDASGMTGMAMNAITSCKQKGSAAACDALGGALLVSSTGATAPADPAIEVKLSANQHIQLTVRVHVPSGQPAQGVRVYRNSREDVLFTGTAMAGVTLDKTLTVDALANDRFLLAIAPTTMGATDVGVHFFVNPTGAVFPQTCKQAIAFEGTTSQTTVGDACNPNDTLQYTDFNSATNPNVVLAPGPFPEQGMGADIVPDKYYVSSATIAKPGDTTTQLWVKIDVMPPTLNGAWVWSDIDLDQGGGLGLVIFDDGPGPELGFSNCTDPNAPAFSESKTSYPNPTQWHFIRAVHTAGKVNICVDGVKKGMIDVATGKLASSYAPRMARNVVWTPAGAFVDGHIDDVRVFSEALPCE